LGPGGIQVSMGEAVEYARSLMRFYESGQINFVV